MPRRTVVSLLLLLALTLGAFLSPPSRADNALGSVTGIVRDTKNQPVNNVVLRIEGGPQLGETRTDRSGRYALGDLAPGAYEVLAQKPGYVSVRKRGVTVTAGEATSLNFRLEWANPDAGAVEVLVTDRNQHRLPGANVDLIANNVIVTSGFTDSEGITTLAGVLPGAYRLNVSRPGFTDAATSTFRVRKQTVTRVTVRLRRDPRQVGVLVGKVMDVAGDPVNNARLRLTSQFSEAEFRTGRDGLYRFTKLVPGSGYTLQITADGFAGQTRGNIVISELGDTLLNVTLLENAPNRGSISGMLRDSEGEPVPLGTVRISVGPELGQEATANENGEYTLTDLRPFNGYAIIATGGGFLPAGVFGLNVRAGRTLSVDLTLRRLGALPGALAGTVRESGAGKTLSNVVVTLVNGPGAGLATTTDSAGRYLLDGLTPGNDYTLQFQLAGFQIATRSQIAVESETTTEVDVELAPRGASVGALIGTITGLNGKAIRNVTVSLTSGASAPRTTTTGRDGAYAFGNLVPDTDYALLAQKQGYLPETRTGLAVVGGGELRQNMVLLKSSQVGGIAGRVLTLVQQPIPNAFVRVIEGPRIPDEVETNANGEFLLTRLPRGEYTLEVSSNSFRTERRTGIQVTPRRTTHLTFTLLQ